MFSYYRDDAGRLSQDQINKHPTLYKLPERAAGRTGSTPQATGGGASDANPRPGGTGARTKSCVVSSSHLQPTGTEFA